MIIRQYYEQLYANKLYALGQVRKFLEKYKIPNLTQGEIDNVTRPIANEKIKSEIKILPLRKAQAWKSLPLNNTNEALTPITYKVF